MGTYHVTERFVSINGEARRAGELSCFIRLAGCNLRCNYCDTRWSCDPDAPSELLSEEELYTWVKETGITNVTLTGGEPLLAPDVDQLLLRLSLDESLHIEVETNGAVPLDRFIGISDRVTYTMDIKCPGSGMSDHMIWENMGLLRPVDTVKCVVSDRNDLDWLREREQKNRRDLPEDQNYKVYISPVFGRIDPKEIVEYMKEYRLDHVRLQLQLHKFIWDPEKKGV